MEPKPKHESISPEQRWTLEAEAPPAGMPEEDEAFIPIMLEAVRALDEDGIPNLLIGGIASSGYGRPRWTHDIDIMIKPEDAERSLECLERRGFDTERTNQRWIYKGFKRDMMVDLIFRPAGGLYLDDAMLSRAVERVFERVPVRLVPPEDLLIMKAVAHVEELPRHWHDALGVIATTELDWRYLERRAMRAPRRILSLLIYAHSLDLLVPNHVIRALYRRLYED